jgi:hypothetical protein
MEIVATIYRHRHHWPLGLVALSVVLLLACGTAAPPAPAADPTTAPIATQGPATGSGADQPAPAEQPTPTPVPQATPAPPKRLTAEMR